jgi:hypothetical protein
LIVIENAVDQNDIDDNEEMENLQEYLLNLSVNDTKSSRKSICKKIKNCITLSSIINSDAILSINILLCPFKISAGITCMSFVRNPCFPDVAFNSRDLIFKISFG